MNLLDVGCMSIRCVIKVESVLFSVHAPNCNCNAKPMAKLVKQWMRLDARPSIILGESIRNEGSHKFQIMFNLSVVGGA